MPTAHKARVGLGIVIVVIALIVVGIIFMRRSEEPPAAVQTTPPPPAATAAPASPPAQKAEVEFVNDRLRREIATQGLTVDRARQLFAVEVGAMPGVTAPDGPVRETFSGTYALTQLLAVRNQLTSEQRAWLHALLDVKQSEPLPKPQTMPTFPPRPPFERPTLRPATYDPDPDVPPATFTLKYLHELYDWANNAVSALTGEPKIPAFDIAFKQFSKPDEKKAWIISGEFDEDSGQRLTTTVNGKEVNVCHSFVDWRKFDAWPIEVHLSVVVHEVVHCYQQQASPDAHAVATTWGWLHDGEAVWAQMVIVPNAAFTSLQTHWAQYLSTPRGHLFARKYDAAGFFGHVSDLAGVDVVGKRLIPVFKAGAEGANEAAYKVLTAGNEEAVLGTWASSYFRTHENKYFWTVKGPGSVNFPSDKAKPDPLTIGAGDTQPLPTVEPWELGLYRLDSSADIVQVISATGHVALIDKSEEVNKALVPFQPISLCLRTECKCPPDTEGQVPETLNATAGIDLALTGGETGTTGWIIGQSLSDHCRPKAKDGPPMGKLPNGISGGSIGGEPTNGKVSSDPHLVTLDGRWYDLQAIGEFVLSRSATDYTPNAFAVHVRFGRIGELSTVSVATAMAVRVGQDRVSVSLDRPPAAPVPVLAINGARATQDFVPLAAGSVRAVFNEAGTGYVIELEDGTRVGISPFARQGLNVWLVPSPALKGKLTGLLGNNDGNSANDPVVRGTSKVLGSSPDYDELYETFANSWRVSQQDSLLEYAMGETTATFTDHAFPDRSARPPDVAVVAAAEASCKAGGILNLNLLKNCAFDLAATGNKRYVRAYQPQQAREDLATALAGLRGNGVVTTSAASGRTKSVVLEGRVTDAAADAFAPFQGFKGDVIYLDPDNCQKPRAMRILAFDGKQLGGIAPACGERLTLPGDGTYRLALNPFHDFTGPYRVSITAVRPDRVTTIAIGDTLAGTLAARAEQDVFLLTMKAAGAITIGGAGCTANGEVSVYYGDAELVGTGPACRLDKVTLPKAGTYRVVINPFNNTTGAYSIPTK